MLHVNKVVFVQQLLFCLSFKVHVKQIVQLSYISIGNEADSHIVSIKIDNRKQGQTAMKQCNIPRICIQYTNCDQLTSTFFMYTSVAKIF